MKKFFRYISVMFLCLMAIKGQAAVILQYHHVSKDTPRLTSVTKAELISHLDWLEKNHFTVLPLVEIVAKLRANELTSTDHVAAITFDDANISVCENAWPILKQRNLPFTLFVSTSIIEFESVTQCSWEQLQEIYKSGQMIVGNHSHHHAHLLTIPGYKKQSQWKTEVVKHIKTNQKIIDNKLGKQPKIFAYPFGEFNHALKLIINELGYIGFGQQSGAIGKNSDFLALPRFPLSGRYSDIDMLPEKLLSLPFPTEIEISEDNPIPFNSAKNPPILTLIPEINLTHKIRCFLGGGSEIQMIHHENGIKVSSLNPLPRGRSRYNCTSESDLKGRYYWVSHQWLIE